MLFMEFSFFVTIKECALFYIIGGVITTKETP